MTTAEEQEKNTRRSIQGYADVMLEQLRVGWRKTLETWFFLKILMREMKFSWQGMTVLLGRYRDWSVVKSHLDDVNEMRSVARKLGVQPDLKAVERYNAQVRRNGTITRILLGMFALAVIVAYFVYRDSVAFEFWGRQISVFTTGVCAFIGGVLLLCDAIGHRYVPPRESEYEARPVSPLKPGMTIRTIQDSLAEILWFHCNEIKITFHGHSFIGDYGVEFEIHTTDKITQEHLAIIEKHMQAGRGRIKLTPNRDNTAAPKLRVFWTDPLADSFTPEPREPKSLSVYDGFKMFRDELGKRVALYIVGAHQFWTGRSGSGKSSALWVFIDWLIDCKDAEVYGIDVGGTVFGPYERLMSGVASTFDEAEEILDKLIEECERRVLLLRARMAAGEDMEDENWVCTEKKGERGIWLIIDEYTKFVKNKALREKVDILYETGRKARVHVVVSTPDASKPQMGGSTAPIAHAMIKVVFGTPFAMITQLFGPGSVEEGWRPDILESGTKHNPADSGKCYVSSGEFVRPVLQRFDRLTPNEIKARNAKRRAHVSGAPSLPEALAILSAAFALHNNPPKLQTAQILEIPAAAGWTANSLAAELRAAAKDSDWIAPAPKPMRFGERSGISGYEFAAVEAAIKAHR